MPNDVTEAAIAMLERSMEEYEIKIRALRSAVNTMCAEKGLPPRYSEEQLAATGARLTQIKDDTFYGKKQTPAMRDYLEMRKAQGLGPAKPREIYDALKTGGYQFDAKDEDVALVGIRALLRTQPNVFHRLPQGTYGLTGWYPDAKRLRAEDMESRSKQKKGGGKKKRAAARAQKTAHAEKPHVAPKPAEKQKPPLKVVDPSPEEPPNDEKAA